MPDDLRDVDPITGEGTAPQAADAKKDKGKGKKKKKKRGCGFFLLMLLLIAGVAVGVQLSGGADLRPFIYWTVPRVPFVGASLASLIDVPAVYSLTTADRRYLELDEWEKLLAEKSRSLDVDEKNLARDERRLDAVSRDLADMQEELRARLEALSNDMTASGDVGKLSPDKQDELKRLIQTFMEMSPKNAAAILEKVNVDLAVHVLNEVPQDFAAKVLGRMEANYAAGLTERLSRLQNNK